MTIALGARGVRGVVLDVEGTTTPVSFVYDVLFPYARSHAGAWLAAHLETGDGREVEQLLRTDWDSERARSEHPPALSDAPEALRLASLLAFVEWSMDRDRKATGLKALQGKIWEDGYRSGALHGEVFPDVAPALRRWREAGLRIAIYSSGSVLAQRLLFASTVAGDLTRLIDAFFDTAVGPKRAAESYRQIARRLDVPNERLLFVSDVTEELVAARDAGLLTVLCMRPGNLDQAAPGDAIRSFDDITR